MGLSVVLLFCLVHVGGLVGVEGARILFFHEISSYSHRLAVWPLVAELAERGHNVSFHQTYRPRAAHTHPLVREACPPSHLAAAEEEMREMGISSFLQMRFEHGRVAFLHGNVGLPFWSLARCEQLLAHPATAAFVEAGGVDVVVVDALFNECGYGLAHVLGAKTVLYFTSHPSGTWGPEVLGFLGTDEGGWMADVVVPNQVPMSFFQRLLTTLAAAAMHLFKHAYYYPRIHHLFRKHLNVSAMPSISQLVQATDLVFYNSHFSEELPRALPPLFVSVPGLHVWNKKTRPLPNDMAAFVEGSGDTGFIYVSFGADLDMGTGPPELQRIFEEAFSQSETRFLWRRSGEMTKEMAGKVFMSEWMPQQDILASPKCKGFIGHGGLLGIQEAIVNVVPMIAIPVFAEQEYNAFRLERTGRGIKLEMHSLTTQTLIEAIHELLTNSTYKEEMMTASKEFRDRQNSPLETAVFWMEYILRHADTSTLRPPALQGYWFQKALLDVWLVLFLTSLAMGAILWYFVRKGAARCMKVATRTKLKTT